jgi:response regulator RpfG family c-di-GMP phosphodiesterase
MPELDGLTVVTRLREREKAAGRPRLPVLALTAFGMKGDRERCLAAGMDGYLSKPIRAADLFAAIDRYAVGPVGDSVLSPASVRAACGGDDGLLRDLVELYRRRAPALLAKVREAVSAGDAAALERAAHACKGVVATFSEPAAAAARKLEHLGRSGHLSGADGVCRELGELLDRLDAELTALTRPDPA